MTSFLCWVQLIGMCLSSLILLRACRIEPQAFGSPLILFYLVAWPVPVGHFIVGAIEALRGDR